MCTVLADVAENILMILTLWFISQDMELARFSGLAMMLANLIKWASAGTSVILIICGVYAKAKKPRLLYA